MSTAEAPAAQPLGLFIPLTKVDVEQRLVYGVATAEKADRSGEICDYATTKPYFETWSSDISKASGGKSLGNVREMHGKSAAGKLTSIKFNDADRQIEVAAKVVDDDAWTKVLEGVYTGFSQGGRYIKRWLDKETGLQRYTAEPCEISLVDLPCLPEATFQVIKAAGADESGAAIFTVEEHAFKPSTAPATTEAPIEVPVVKAAESEPAAEGAAEVAEATAAAAATAVAAEVEKAATDDDTEPDAALVDGEQIALAKADPEGPQLVQFWKCECDDHQHKTLKAARKCQRTFRAEAAAKAAAAPVADLAAEIAGMLGKDAATVEQEAARKALEERSAKKTALHVDLAKWMGEEVWDAGQALSALSTLTDLLQHEMYETDNEPEQIAALRAAIERVKAFIASEIQENNDESDSAKALDRAVAQLEIAKRGSRNSAADQERLQKCHDLMKDLGAECLTKSSPQPGPSTETLEKALADAAQSRAEKAALQAQMDGILPTLQVIKDTVAKISASPAPARAAVNALGLEALAGRAATGAGSPADEARKWLENLPPDQRAHELMKLSLANPVR